MAKYVYDPICGFQAANVLVSQYNENGECPCLKCNPCTGHCRECEQYKKLLKEADENQWLRLERCISCLNYTK